jgi:hypothetical protein
MSFHVVQCSHFNVHHVFDSLLQCGSVNSKRPVVWQWPLALASHSTAIAPLGQCATPPMWANSRGSRAPLKTLELPCGLPRPCSSLTATASQCPHSSLRRWLSCRLSCLPPCRAPGLHLWACRPPSSPSAGAWEPCPLCPENAKFEQVSSPSPMADHLPWRLPFPLFLGGWYSARLFPLLQLLGTLPPLTSVALDTLAPDPTGACLLPWHPCELPSGPVPCFPRIPAAWASAVPSETPHLPPPSTSRPSPSLSLADCNHLFPRSVKPRKKKSSRVYDTWAPVASVSAQNHRFLYYVLKFISWVW